MNSIYFEFDVTVREEHQRIKQVLFHSEPFLGHDIPHVWHGSLSSSGGPLNWKILSSQPRQKRVFVLSPLPPQHWILHSSWEGGDFLSPTGRSHSLIWLVRDELVTASSLLSPRPLQYLALVHPCVNVPGGWWGWMVSHCTWGQRHNEHRKLCFGRAAHFPSS